MDIPHKWIRDVYPIFCEAEQVAWPPPYKDFAGALSEAMPRRRKELWKKGNRITTTTVYTVSDPTMRWEPNRRQLAALRREQRRHEDRGRPI